MDTHDSVEDIGFNTQTVIDVRDGDDGAEDENEKNGGERGGEYGGDASKRTKRDDDSKLYSSEKRKFSLLFSYTTAVIEKTRGTWESVYMMYHKLLDTTGAYIPSLASQGLLLLLGLTFQVFLVEFSKYVFPDSREWRVIALGVMIGVLILFLFLRIAADRGVRLFVNKSGDPILKKDDFYTDVDLKVESSTEISSNSSSQRKPPCKKRRGRFNGLGV
jgi:hypothetical protein